VSVVTFAAGSEALRAIGMAPAGFMVAVLALMETPAILTGLWLAKRGQSEALAPRGGLWDETCFKGLVVLLIGSFIIGVVAGEKGLAPIAPVFDTLFKGRLCLFLLGMGLVAALDRQSRASLAHRGSRPCPSCNQRHAGRVAGRGGGA
jgi:hypothetical protein